jgi:hypothetical protein
MNEKSLYKTEPKSGFDNNIEAIKAYIISGGEGQELTKTQAELKERIEFADSQIRNKNGFLKRAAIALIICDRFDVNRDTAYRYMRHAENIYASNNPLDKKHRILLRIEFCEQQSHLAAMQGEYRAVAALESTIQKYIDSYPDIERGRNTRNQVFILPTAILDNTKNITEDTAVEIISQHLKKIEDGNQEDQFE